MIISPSVGGGGVNNKLTDIICLRHIVPLLLIYSVVRCVLTS